MNPEDESNDLQRDNLRGPLTLTDQIIAYEEGELDEEEVDALFAALIESGLVWQLQGSYGRTAVELIAAGRIVGYEMEYGLIVKVQGDDSDSEHSDREEDI